MVPISSEQFLLWVSAFVWPFIRILSLVVVAPVFQHRAVSNRIRVGIAGAIAVLVSAQLPQPPLLDDTELLGLILQQVIVGATLGFSIRIIFAAFEMAGDFLGLQIGLAFAQFIDPGKGYQTALLGTFLSLLASLVFLALNGHLMIISAIVKSFEIVPISANLNVIQANSLALSGQLMFDLALQMSMPVLAALLMANLILGLLTRAAPQMNIISIGFSFTIIAGLLVLWLTLPFFTPMFEDALTRMLSIEVLRVSPL